MTGQKNNRLALMGKALDSLISILTIGTLIMIVATVFMAVVMRYVFHSPLLFSFDLSTLLFAWLIFLGLYIAHRDDAHMSLDLLPNIREGKFKLCLIVLRQILACMLTIYLSWIGYKLFQRTGAQISSLRISAKWLYASMPIGFGLLALAYFADLIRLILGQEKKNQ